MSEAKFTKGPWEAFQDSTGSFYVNCRSREDDVITEHSPTVCGTWGAIYSKLKGDECSDAHLIAAAPEMYKMLETIIYASNHTGEDSLYEDEIKALLAKARGEK